VWQFIARDRNGVALAELRNVHGRNVRFPFLQQPTMTGQVDANHPLAAMILAGDLTIVSGYDLSVQAAPLIQGPVVGYQKSRNASGGQIQFTVVGAGWYLSHRIIGHLSSLGATFGTTSLSMLDRGEIIGRIIDACNVGDPGNINTQAGNTTIRRGTIAASSSTYVSGWTYKNAWEAITDLAGTLDGPDIRIRYVEPYTDATGLVLGLMDVAPAMGAPQPNCVFAFGTPPDNVAEWTDTGDSNTLANWAVNLPSGFPDNAIAQPVTWSDTASIADRGLHETVVAADLVTDDLRLKLVQENVRVRKTPRRVIGFTPVAEDQTVDISQRRGQRLFVDYNVGDVIVFRAVERFDVEVALQMQAASGGLLPSGTLLPSGALLPGASLDASTASIIEYVAIPTVDLLMRVFVAELAIDDNGVATPSLTLQADGS
jgi:hypothetical protein